MVYLFGRYFSDDLGKLGMIAPIVSGVMACYTLLYVFYEGKKDRRQNPIMSEVGHDVKE